MVKKILCSFGIPLALIVTAIMYPQNPFVERAGVAAGIFVLIVDLLLFLAVVMLHVDDKTGKPRNTKMETIKMATNFITETTKDDKRPLVKFKKFISYALTAALFIVGHRFLAIMLGLSKLLIYAIKQSVKRYIEALDPRDVK